jgi:bacillithiol synthase
MNHQSLPLSVTGAFPTLFLDYIAQKDSLKPFYGYFPTIDNFEKQIQEKTFDTAKRKTLVQSLERQYKSIKIKPDISKLLNDNTFTVTTGHQLNIFTGPLYVIYKIVTAINLAKALKEKYPHYDFVPVYWMATEDHDFEEISSFNLFGKKYNWQTQQHGAVGRMNPRELGGALKILPEKVPVFEKAYLKNNTLAGAVRCYMNDLFGSEGLVCIDGDDADLKRQFLPIIEDELINQRTFEIVKKTTADIEALGYHTQISPREINLFYLDEQLRERIVGGGAEFKIQNSELKFNEETILQTAHSNPKKMSPNVVLRPLYQEVILPNLAYIGGPSEVPYWLQLKGIFEHYQVPFPMLMPRNFALYVTEINQKKAEKLGFTIEELFEEDTKLKKRFVAQTTTETLTLDDEKNSFEQLFNAILAKAAAIDKSLEGTVNAEKTKLLSSLENLEKRIQKAEERNYESEINQLLGLKNKLFPNGGLQERYDNFLNFYLNDSQFLQKLLATFDPLDYRFNVLIENK